MQSTVVHTQLGILRCLRDSASLIKIRGLPYATIPQRFARAELLDTLEASPQHRNGIFDATKPGPSSIQPKHSVTSDASNIPLPTSDLPDDEEQAEACLNLSIHIPSNCFDPSGHVDPSQRLPVLVFIHGGAFFLGSGNRPYYDPTNLMLHGIARSTPFVFVSINYRLGILGFLHSPHSDGLVPENNGLYDQDLALEWVHRNIGGFGGDPENMTVVGQSAGGESVSLKTSQDPLFKRAIAFSGTPVTMPCLTPEEHHSNFLKQAELVGINTRSGNGEERSAKSIAEDLCSVSVDRIRDLAWVGLPCSASHFLPVRKPSMDGISKGELAPSYPSASVEAQIVGTTTYDGGISYNMLQRDESRGNHASAFISIADDVLGKHAAKELCNLYAVHEGSEDSDALERICLFESDVGFFAAALATAEANLVPNTYFHIFDLPNPFEGPIREKGKFATHTFDIVTLLGGVHEEQLPKRYAGVIREWRDRILDFVVGGKAPCAEFIQRDGRRKGLIIDEGGVKEIDDDAWLGNDDGRRSRLFGLAQRIAGDAGCDLLWVDVCRRFLMKGE